MMKRVKSTYSVKLWNDAEKRNKKLVSNIRQNARNLKV